MNGGPVTPPQRVAFAFNPQADGAASLAEHLRADVEALGREAWVVRDADDPAEVEGADLVVTLGGDGTVLRTARLLTGTMALILGVNLGRLGFLTEFDGHEARERLPELLHGAGRIENRTMLRARIGDSGQHYHALNEAVIGRSTLSRALQLAVDVDGVRIADYRSDGVIVATATGSTAYALSVGGPILAPESHELVVVPVAPHLAAQHAVVLPETETVRITLEPGQQAVLSLDGQVDLDVREGDIVTVDVSQHHARFLRLKERSDFYVRMAAQLGWHRPGGNARPLPRAGK